MCTGWTVVRDGDEEVTRDAENGAARDVDGFYGTGRGASGRSIR